MNRIFSRENYQELIEIFSLDTFGDENEFIYLCFESISVLDFVSSLSLSLSVSFGGDFLLATHFLFLPGKKSNIFAFSSLIIQDSVCYRIVWFTFSIVVSICLVFLTHVSLCVVFCTYCKLECLWVSEQPQRTYSLFFAYLFNLFGRVLTLPQLKSQQLSALAQAKSAITTCCALIYRVGWTLHGTSDKNVTIVFQTA